ncbi:MAG: histidine--tRNA ligase [Lachnospiraceae bacterium]|nr:histidine--tRNA ligase [Lachnospiraceae bacterium]
MGMIKKPTTGMKDILPAEMQIRDYVTGLVKETYQTFGFTPIETPAVEHIENLLSKQGGENEKLIFKILKRGEKLVLGADAKEEDLADSGLRYDLTLPLSRFYACHAAELPAPFKALQIGPVWRADRPQKGRFRQFVQCDIDILGDPTSLAEIELITATTTLLGKLDLKDFTVRINDRRILKAMASFSGFNDSDLDTVFIILDKMDKIGKDGVAEELVTSGFSKDCVDKYIALFEGENFDTQYIKELADKLGDHLDAECADSLIGIINSVERVKNADFHIVFDPTLVRGMSYYTGTIFEITMNEFGSSVAGGGRYDEMIGRFTGNKVCACGFSIGFERIITILLDKGFVVPGSGSRYAFLIEKGADAGFVASVMEEAAKLRQEGKTVLVSMMNKNKKFQKEQLEKEGFTSDNIKEFYHSDFKK